MGLFTSLQENYDELWKAIIRPPRDIYDPVDLGPNTFHISGKVYTRTDLELLNGRNQRLLCSHFEPSADSRPARKLPCIIYMHGNCSSRLEALSTLPLVLSLNCSLFCFDFSGSGLSDGSFVSLGYFERDDLGTVIDFLRSLDTVSTIGLWGRSMGAATALLHVPRDPTIAAIVADSSFADLRLLVDELVHLFLSPKVPKFLVSWGLGMVRSSIKSRANFDIFNLSPLEGVGTCFVPALFAAAEGDTFIKADHSRKLHEGYGGDKNLVIVPGEHNSARPRFFLDSVAIFFLNTLFRGEGAMAMPSVVEVPRAPAFLKARSIKGMRGRTEEEERDLQRAIEASLKECT